MTTKPRADATALSDSVEALRSRLAACEAVNHALRARQAASDKVTRAISASPADPQPVFELIARKVKDLYGAHAVSVAEFDGTLIHQRALIGHEPDAAARLLAAFPRPPGDDTGPGRVVLSGKPVYVREIDKESGFIAAGRALGAGSYFGVPLLHEGRVAGVLGLWRADFGEFNEALVEIAQAFAEQAVIAIAGAKTLRALRARTAELAERNDAYGERIEQQAATIDVLQAMSASPGDAQPVFEAIARRARAFCEADAAAVMLANNGQLHLRTHAGATEAAAVAYEASFPRPVDESTVTGRAVLARDAVIIPDLQADPVFGLKNIGAASALRSVAAVPMLRGGVPIGGITIGRFGLGTFSAAQMELLKTFAEQAAIAAAGAETYRALQERTAELAERNDAFAERIEHQAATIDVLKEMSASPGDPQPVFDMICGQAQALLGTSGVGLFEYDGEMVHYRANVDNGAFSTSGFAAYTSGWPRVPDRGSITCRAILAGTTIHIRDLDADSSVSQMVRDLGHRTQISVPLMREGRAIGAISTGSMRVDGVSDTQIELLKTFAEQAVIAITSAETFRALQTRTADLQESLEYQTATSDVLKVISRSAFALQPVLDSVVQTAARLCDADIGYILTRDGEAFRSVAAYATVPGADAVPRDRVMTPGRGSAVARAIQEQRTILIEDALADPEYTYSWAIDSLKIRTTLGVPMFRNGEVVGGIGFARMRVWPFTDRQIELLSTFADQVVIAMENARLIAEQKEALEQQTATAEVLGVINASPGDLAPVFWTMLDRALRLCGAAFGELVRIEGETFTPLSIVGMPDAFVERRVGSPTPIKPGTAGWGFLSGDNVVHIPDLMETEGYRGSEPTRRVLVDDGGVRALLGVALRKDDALLGAISLFRREPGAFTEKQIALLKNFAAQAVIAMENARLLTETREALEQQTATAEVLQVINASPGELTPVFDAMLERAMRLCEAAFGALYTYDGDQIRMAATRGVPEAYAVQQAQGPLRPAPGGTVGRALASGRPAQILDVKAGDLYKSGHANVRAFVDLGGARTMLCVPLVKDGTSIGYFQIYRQEVLAFSGKQIALLENFAAQAVIAMENARLLTETKEALEQQTATSEVLGVINASPGNLTPVFDGMLERALRLCGAYCGGLLIRDGTNFKYQALRGMPAAFAELRLGQSVPMAPESPPGRMLRTGRTVPVLDTLTDSYFAARPELRDETTGLGGARSVLNVPLLKEGTVVGAFVIFREAPGNWPDRQVALLENFAAQAVIAMENARLLAETREALEQQTATADVLRVINANPGDLGPVFDAILEKAHVLCGADLGSLMTFDGQHAVTAATHNYPDELTELARRPFAPTLGMRALVDGARLVHTPDARTFDPSVSDDQVGQTFMKVSGVRTYLLLPLRRDDALVGFLSAHRHEVRPYTSSEIALLESFAAQAVIAMENARLLRETQEALEQQTATAEVLGVINANPGDLTPVFDTILRKAHDLCGATIGSLSVYDGEYYRALASHGFPKDHDTVIRRPYSPGPLHRRLLSGEAYVHVLDRKTHEPSDAEPAVRSLVENTGVRTGLVVALRKDDVLLGHISAFRLEVKAFTEREINLLQNFAAQAVIAMENARLLTETREALEQQTATAEVLGVINASPGNLTPVFEAILEKAHRICHVDMGSLWTFDGTTYRMQVTRGYGPRARSLVRAPSPKWTPQRRLLAGDRYFHAPDITTYPWDADDTLTPSMAAATGGRAVLIVPLRKDGSLQGHITSMRREPGPFSDKEIALLENFAAQAVIAMENARLLNEVRQRQEELRITFENMGDGVAMFDAEPRLVAWNNKFQEIFDVPADLLEQRQTYADYIRFLAERGDYGPDTGVDDMVRRTTESTGQQRVYERTRPDGRIVEVRNNPVDGGGFVLIFADITERKRNEAAIAAARDAAEEATRTIEAAYRDLKIAQANLVQAEKMASLGQLTAGIAHEIKNPLNFVNNFASLSVELLEEFKEAATPALEHLTEDQRADADDLAAMLTSNLKKIEEHGKRADGIVKAMLEHSRGASGERRAVDLNALIEEALNLAYHGARARDQSFNITLERDFAAGLAPIEVNPQDLTRVFLNLFGNGFYAASKRARDSAAPGFDPTLRVTTLDLGDRVDVQVRDNGTGIPPEIRDKLFEPFFTTKPAGEGTGLGLSITYDIVTKQHGGSIAVDSVVGDHTTFCVTLPRQMFVQAGGVA